MKKLYRITALALVMLICLSVFAVNAFAAEPQNLMLSAKVAVTGKKPSPAEKYTVVLETLDSNNPMPAGSKDGKYNLTITGAGKEDFPAIQFPTAGIYQYKIYQLAGKATNAKYDNTVYTAVVYVLNSEKEEDSLTIFVMLKNNATGEKLGEVFFKNEYYDPNIPKTGDSGNLALYATLGLASAVALIFVAVFGKKRKNKD